MIFTFVLYGMLIHMAAGTYGNELSILESKVHSVTETDNTRYMVLIKKCESFELTGSAINEKFVLTVPDYVDDINEDPKLYDIYYRYYEERSGGGVGYASMGVKKAYKNQYYPVEDDYRSDPEPIFNAGLIEVSDDEGFTNRLLFYQRRSVYKHETVSVSGHLTTPGEKFVMKNLKQTGIIVADVLQKEECQAAYKGIRNIHGFEACIDPGSDTGKFEKMDLGAPVCLPKDFVIGFVSFIPTGDCEGKPIIITDMITVTLFINRIAAVKGFLI